jgi:DNA-binding NarL/FixJ family response regulator
MSDIRVLIVDDISQVRQDLRTLLTLAGGIDIVGEAGDGAEAVRLAGNLQPEVVLMDLEMPVMDGLEAARRIKKEQPQCRVIILTIYDDQAEREKAFLSGADLFLEKGIPLDILLDAIQGRNNQKIVNI